LSRIDEPHLEAARGEEFEERNPIDAGRFHRDGLDTASAQPLAGHHAPLGKRSSRPDLPQATLPQTADYPTVTSRDPAAMRRTNVYPICPRGWRPRRAGARPPHVGCEVTPEAISSPSTATSLSIAAGWSARRLVSCLPDTLLMRRAGHDPPPPRRADPIPSLCQSQGWSPRTLHVSRPGARCPSGSVFAPRILPLPFESATCIRYV